MILRPRLLCRELGSGGNLEIVKHTMNRDKKNKKSKIL